MRVALVLSAGGPVGYAYHAGVLAALADAGWDPRNAGLLVGTSMGSVTAGLLRAGMASEDLYARVQHTPLSPDGEALLQRAGGWPTFPAPSAGAGPRWGRPASPALIAGLIRNPRRVRPGLVLAGLANTGRVDPSPIASVFDRLLPAGLDGSTWVCAVDLDRGARVVFGRSDAPPATPGQAVAASCAVPSYMAPVEIAGRRYVDGGVHSPANTDLVGALAGDPFRPDAVVLSLSMGAHGPAGRRGADLPGRRRNSASAAAGLAPLVDAGVPVLRAEPTARELEVMHYDAFDLSELPGIARRARQTLADRLSAPSGPTAEALSVLLADR